MPSPGGAYRVGLTAAGHALAVTREETSLGWVGSGHYESDLAEVARTEADPFARYLRKAMCEWRIYHFHDTSLSAGMRQAQPVRDNLQLHADGSNLAPFLRHIRERHPAEYGRILDTVRLAAPFIKDFLYRDEPGERVDLEWLERSLEQGRTFGPRQLSGGTIRFTCLATLLLQPVHMQPSTILIDEPELGLHPAAIKTLAALLSRASEARQVIVSTQSVDLLNEMRPDDVLVAERCDDASVFRRLDLDQLAEWLSDHRAWRAVDDEYLRRTALTVTELVHPSARLGRTLNEPGYDKRLEGPAVAALIGLERIRTECRHFGHWLSRLEALPPLGREPIR